MLFSARVTASTSRALPDTSPAPGRREKSYLIEATGKHSAEVAAGQLALAELATEGLRPAGTLEIALDSGG
jgi:hypothetical protein